MTVKIRRAPTSPSHGRRPGRHRIPEPSNFFLLPSMKRTDLEFDKVQNQSGLSGAIDREGIVAAISAAAAGDAVGVVAWAFYEPGVEQFSQYDPDKSAATSKPPAGCWARRRARRTEWGSPYPRRQPGRDQVAAIAAMFQEIGVVMHVEPRNRGLPREARPPTCSASVCGRSMPTSCRSSSGCSSPTTIGRRRHSRCLQGVGEQRF